MLNKIWHRLVPIGLALFALGVICNYVVIKTNGGYMPLSPAYINSVVVVNQDGERVASERTIVLVDINSGEPIATSTEPILPQGYKVIDENTKDIFLADIFHLPILRGEWSIGDFFIIIGVLSCSIGLVAWLIREYSKEKRGKLNEVA
jgi:hypothetical protein